MIIQEKKLTSIFEGQDGIIAVYFFGSQVSGKTDHFSDYDFAVLFKDKRYIIRELGLPSAVEYWQVPTMLANTGYIEEEDSAKYVRMARFRNLVVHFYYKVNPEEIYKILTEELSDIRKWRDRLLEIIDKIQKK